MDPDDRARRDLTDQIAAVALLHEPVRRSLYDLVAARGEIGRDEAAKALGIGRALAAFHLEKLAAAGVLETSYRRLSGRRGPGAGRPAKLYRRSGRQLEVSLPARHYQLLARLLLNGIRRGATPTALRETTREAGAAVAAEAGRRAGDRQGRVGQLASLRSVLGEQGFQPQLEEGELRLRNCPFDALSREDPDLVCGLSLAYLQGMAGALPSVGLRPVLDPQPGRCCVVFRPDPS